MTLLSNIFIKFMGKSPLSNQINNFVFYKIVDLTQSEEVYYKVQCINTKAVFLARIIDIVNDIDILYNLHPIQSCFVGIEYAKELKKFNNSPHHYNRKKLLKYSKLRYGRYSINYQDRENHICFIDNETKNEYLMDSRDIALSKELIEEFDAAQAFHIGILAGLKLEKPILKNNRKRAVRLELIK